MGKKRKPSGYVPKIGDQLIAKKKCTMNGGKRQETLTIGDSYVIMGPENNIDRTNFYIIDDVGDSHWFDMTYFHEPFVTNDNYLIIN